MWKFKLPQPKSDIDETKEWLPVERIYPQFPPPFGYKVDPLDPYILLPIPHELDVLEKAKKLSAEFTYDEVAHWVREQTGRQISGGALNQRFKDERKRRNRVRRIHAYTKRIEEAKAAAQKIERSSNGRFRTCQPETRRQYSFDFGDSGGHCANVKRGSVSA